MRTFLLAGLFALQASSASAAVTFLNCTLPDVKGKPLVWGLKLNEESGTVQVFRGASPLNKDAVFRPSSITFRLFGAAIDINRVSGLIRRTSIDGDGRHVSNGKCVVANDKRAF